MAKGVYQIKLNYQKATGQAAEMDKLAKKLKQIADGDVNNIRGKIQGNWHGSNANKYTQKVSKLAKSLRSTADQITAAANTVRTIATNTYNADMKVEKLARERSYSGGGGGGGFR